jgi:hypothetical protein
MTVTPVAEAARGLEGILIEDLDVQDEPSGASLSLSADIHLDVLNNSSDHMYL